MTPSADLHDAWLAWAAGVQALLLGVGVLASEPLEFIEEFQVPPPTPGIPDRAPAEQASQGAAGDPAPAAATPDQAARAALPPPVEAPPPEPVPAVPEVLDIPEPPPLAQLDLIEALPVPPPEPEPAPDTPEPRADTPEPRAAPTPPARTEPAPAASSSASSSGAATGATGRGSGSGSGQQGGGGAASGPIREFRGGGGGSFPAPSYPSRSRRRGEEGTVLVYVEVAGNGRPSAVSVARSSGYSALDREATRTVQRYRWSSGPARYHVPITFRLE